MIFPQFTAYLNDPNYVEPVPLETLTRSFYEVRPTDTQYLELFYMDARCAEFSFIGVNDTGRCSVGETNRFTTQKGGCERYLELATVNPIALHKGDRRPAKAGRSAGRQTRNRGVTHRAEGSGSVGQPFRRSL